MPFRSQSTPDASLLSTQEFEADRFDHYSRVGVLLAIGVHGLFLIAGLLLGAPQLALLQVVSVVVYAISLLIRRKRKLMWLNVSLVYLDLLGHSTLAGWIVGVDAGFSYYSWILLPLLFTNINRSLRQKVTMSIVLTAIFIGVDWWLHHTQPVVHVDPDALAVLRYFNIGCFLLALGVASYGKTMTLQQAEERMRTAAGTDSLTGLMNRRRMTERMAEEAARARRSQQPLSAVLIDIDHFKSINDEHGHAQGDWVIRRVADTLRTGIREVDFVGRWGGEEFVILLPDTDVQAAAELAERIRRTVRTQLCRHVSNDQRHVTITAGVSTLRSLESIEATLHRADVALYDGKRAGRDRVVVGEGDLGVDLRAAARHA